MKKDSNHCYYKALMYKNIKRKLKTGITEGYGESGLGVPELPFALDSDSGTALIWGGGSADTSLLGSGFASVGAGRALLVVVIGIKATPICCIQRQIQI